jgi:hypothetical protein
MTPHYYGTPYYRPPPPPPPRGLSAAAQVVIGSIIGVVLAFVVVIVIFTVGRGNSPSSTTRSTAISIPTPAPTDPLCPPGGDCPPDPDGYLLQIRAAGITVLNQTASVNTGWVTCNHIASGITPASVAASLQDNVSSLTVKQANSVVDASLIYLCPKTGTVGMLLPGQMTN